MGTSLYSVLGVGRDADAETIERAYRDRAKTHHPDVSDDPDAGDRFKRLTFARDTLTDEDDRARYDRIGHETYVRQHAPPGLFEVDRVDVGVSGGEPESRGGARTAATATGGRTAATATGGRTAATATDGGTTATWWDAGDEGFASTPGSGGNDGGVSTTSRSPGSTASTADFYSRDRVARGGTDTVGPIRRVWNAARVLGPWLVVHLWLLASALAVGSVAVSKSVTANLALPGLLCLFGLAAAALFASALHVVTVLYT